MRILVIEDFPPIRKALVQGLREAGYAVDEAANGEDGLWLAESGEHDVIILDLMLPKVDGLSILKSLRKKDSAARVLVLTAKDTLDDKITGLELGADDYVVKPFHFAEILSRVKALVRRKYDTTSNQLSFGDLEIDLGSKMVKRGGRRLDLSAREFALMEFFALNAGKIVSRSDIWQHVYDFNASPESNVVDVYVARLRAKIDDDASRGLIHTKRGQGYWFGKPEE
jgi:DNA-binding response OmpR family regulator